MIYSIRQNYIFKFFVILIALFFVFCIFFQPLSASALAVTASSAVIGAIVIGALATMGITISGQSGNTLTVGEMFTKYLLEEKQLQLQGFLALGVMFSNGVVKIAKKAWNILRDFGIWLSSAFALEETSKILYASGKYYLNGSQTQLQFFNSYDDMYKYFVTEWSASKFYYHNDIVRLFAVGSGTMHFYVSHSHSDNLWYKNLVIGYNGTNYSYSFSGALSRVTDSAKFFQLAFVGSALYGIFSLQGSDGRTEIVNISTSFPLWEEWLTSAPSSGSVLTHPISAKQDTSIPISPPATGDRYLTTTFPNSQVDVSQNTWADEIDDAVAIDLALPWNNYNFPPADYEENTEIAFGKLPKFMNDFDDKLSEFRENLDENIDNFLDTMDDFGDFLHQVYDVIPQFIQYFISCILAVYVIRKVVGR